MGNSGSVDKLFLSIVIILVLAGLFIFSSASLGLLVREGVSFKSIAFNQLFYGLILGSIAMYICSRIDFRFWGKHAFWIFVASIAVTALVFIPGLGFSHGGATRWLELGPLSFQPAELLKLGFVIYYAAWLSSTRSKVTSIKSGILPLFAILLIVGTLLLPQPDTDTFVIILLAAAGMFVVAGGKWRHIFSLGGATIAGIAGLALLRPYIKARLLTFLDPSADPFGSGYQIQQSLIAIGSGQWGGRGYGQSIQKFNYLPEPIGDSIFAVFAEEWGFIGAVILILLFVFFALRGFRIASHAPNSFGRLLVTGIVILIVSQSLFNIAAMLNIVPLAGMPLIFVSQGGTALLMALASVGIVLNVSRYARK